MTTMFKDELITEDNVALMCCSACMENSVPALPSKMATKRDR